MEGRGALLDELGEGRDLPGLGDAIPNEVIQADAELLGGRGQRLEGMPGEGAVGGAGTVGDVAFKDATTGAEFGVVIVEREFGVVRVGQ